MQGIIEKSHWLTIWRSPLALRQFSQRQRGRPSGGA